jgi:hypothetical protein
MPEDPFEQARREMEQARQDFEQQMDGLRSEFERAAQSSTASSGSTAGRRPPLLEGTVQRQLGW